MPPKASQKKNTGSKANPKASTSQPPSKKAKGSQVKIIKEKTIAPEEPEEGHSTDSDVSLEAEGDDVGYVTDITEHSFGFSEDSDKDFPGETPLEKRARISKKKRVRADRAAKKSTPSQNLNSKYFF